MPDDVKIRIKAEGGPAAREELKGTGEAVKNLGEGEGQAARGTESLSQKTDQATKSQTALNDAAKTAVTQGLGALNPQLGQAANLVLSLAKGVGGLSLSLLSMAGAGVAIAAVAAAFRAVSERAEQAAAAIKRVTEATREQAAEQLGERVTLAAAMEKAGLMGKAPEAQAAVERLLSQGVPRDVAGFGAMAGQIGGLSDEQTRQVMGAWLATGRKGELIQNEGANRRLIGQLLGYDAQQAATALSAKMRDVAPAAAGESAAMPTTRADEIETLILKRLKARGYTDSEAEVGLRLLMGADPLEFRSQANKIRYAPLKWSDPTGKLTQWPWETLLGEQPGIETTHTMGELVKAAFQARKDVSVPADSAGATYRVNVQHNTINVDTFYGPTLDALRRNYMPATADLIEPVAN